MRKFLLALILVLCATPVFAQSFGRVEADLLRANGTIENIAPEATAAVIRIYTDDGDDNADKYSLNVSTADVFSIQNNGTAIWSLTSAGAITSPSTASFTTTATVLGAEAGDASVVIDADEGDDNADTWTIRSTASDNDLDILNHTSVIVNVTSAGAVSAAELTLSGVTGSGKAVCVKADGAMGVCGDAVGGSGTCTCS